MTAARGLFLTAPGALELRSFELAALGPGDVLVEVAGCGLCHTDISFYTGAVRTKHPLPLVLGHEIAGHGRRRRAVVRARWSAATSSCPR